MSRRKRSVAERIKDFDDIFLPYTDAQARWEASRCLSCYNAPCNLGCETNIDVRAFIQLIRFDDVIGAAEMIRRANVLGGTCARVCEAEGQCMSVCTRSKIDTPIDIPGLQWYALESERRYGGRPLPVGVDRGRSVAVVGGGPAGLASVAELRRLGHRVTLFEARERVGGVLNAGIPSFRLSRSVVDAEVEAILQTGVEVHVNYHVGSVDELLKSFDAVIVSIGVGRSARLGVDGEDLGGVISSDEFLAGLVRDVGLRPMVVGGGTSAVDAATTALRIAGNEGRVAILYRRAEQQMPAYAQLRELGTEEGVVLRPLTVVDRILGDRDGRVAAVRCRSVDLGPVDSSGRPGPVELSGGTFDLQASSVIVAAGEELDPGMLARLNLTEAEPRGDENGRTDLEKLYVAGDIVGGQRTVSWAIGSGVRAARAVDFDLRSGSEPERVYPVLGMGIADLSVELFGHTLQNPFLLSASPATDDLEMARAGLAAGWAGLIIRTTSVEGTEVDPRYPSMYPLADGPRMLGALGNIELISEKHVESVVERVAALKEEFPDRFIAASIMGETRSQWQRLTRHLVEAGVDAVEASFSAPQGSLGSRPGAMVGQDHTLVRTVTRWLKDAAPHTPILIKITPQVADLGQIAKAVADGGGDGITATNSIPGLPGVEVDRRAPLPSVGGCTSFSGITGPAIFPLALRSVAEVARASDLVIAGSGGVENWRDAASMLLMGASVVQVCTAVIHHGFRVIEPLTTGLAHYMERAEVERLSDIIGAGLENVIAHEDLKQPGPVRARIDEETCIACGRCYITCRDGAYRAIKWNEDLREPTVSLERCTGCGLCAGVCPSDSISYLTLGK